MTYSDVIVMLSRQRSDTDALGGVLGAHPDIFSVPESFSPQPRADVRREVETNYFEFLERHASPSVKSVLVSAEAQERLFLDHLHYLRCFSDERYVLLDVKYDATHNLDGPRRDLSAEPALFGILKRNRVRILHVTRSNYLRSCLVEPRDHDGRWEAPLDGLLAALERCQDESDMVARSFSDHELCHTVEYEQLVTGSRARRGGRALAAIASWLELDGRFPTARPQADTPDRPPLHETVENYDEIADLLAETQFAWCLDGKGAVAGAAAR